MRYTCPHCNRPTTGLYPTLNKCDKKGVHYYCTCEICLNTTSVTASASMLRLTNLTKKLHVERFFLN